MKFFFFLHILKQMIQKGKQKVKFCMNDWDKETHSF